jgi:hypothetical protein
LNFPLPRDEGIEVERLFRKAGLLALDQVGSYGRQMGRLGDVIAVLVDKLDRRTLSEAELDAVKAFEAQLADVRRVKAEAAASAAAVA